jgi:predicted ATPase
MAPVAYIGSRPQLYPLIALKAVNYGLRYGPTLQFSHCYSDYAIMLCSVFGDPKAGYAFSEAAIKLSERFKSASMRAISLFIHGHMINFWLKPLATASILKGFHQRLDSATCQCWLTVLCCRRLSAATLSTCQVFQKYASFARSCRNDAVYRSIVLESNLRNAWQV